MEVAGALGYEECVSKLFLSSPLFLSKLWNNIPWKKADANIEALDEMRFYALASVLTMEELSVTRCYKNGTVYNKWQRLLQVLLNDL
jgi:hypothetical protein